MEKVKIVEVFPLKIWVEKDIMGSSHIMMQHDYPGQKPFQYASFFYDYAYTSNSGIHAEVVRVMERFNIAEKDIVWKQRTIDILEAQTALNAIEQETVKKCAEFLRTVLDDHFAAEQLENHFAENSWR